MAGGGRPLHSRPDANAINASMHVEHDGDDGRPALCDTAAERYTAPLLRWAKRRAWDWSAKIVRQSLARRPLEPSDGFPKPRYEWLAADDCGVGMGVGTSSAAGQGSGHGSGQDALGRVRQLVAFTHGAARNFYLAREVAVRLAGHADAKTVPCLCFESCKLSVWRCFLDWAHLCGPQPF